MLYFRLICDARGFVLCPQPIIAFSAYETCSTLAGIGSAGWPSMLTFQPKKISFTVILPVFVNTHYFRYDFNRNVIC